MAGSLLARWPSGLAIWGMSGKWSRFVALQKCRECGQDISTEAIACPSCGCPQRPTAEVAGTAQAVTRKISHIFGWIALISFLMSNFIPAILASFFVLSGLIFAALEIGRGGKIFGGILFALCALQAWFVVDHFSGLSGSLGITNPKQIEEDTAKKYSAVNSDIPSNLNQIIEQKCAAEWPNDFRMRSYCQDQQRQGVAALSQGRPQAVSQDAYAIIRGKCAQEWPQDFKMRSYCESQQYEGYYALQQTPPSSALRGGCAQQWPNDYRMRQYCESKQR